MGDNGLGVQLRIKAIGVMLWHTGLISVHHPRPKCTRLLNILNGAKMAADSE